MYHNFVSVLEAVAESSHCRLESSLMPRVSRRSLRNSFTMGTGSELSELLELAYFSRPHGLEPLKKTSTNQLVGFNYQNQNEGGYFAPPAFTG